MEPSVLTLSALWLKVVGGRLEGVQPRGSDVDDHWVVLVLEEVEDAQRRCTHSGCPEKHLETRACGQSLRQKSS